MLENYSVELTAFAASIIFNWLAYWVGQREAIPNHRNKLTRPLGPNLEPSIFPFQAGAQQGAVRGQDASAKCKASLIDDLDICPFPVWKLDDKNSLRFFNAAFTAAGGNDWLRANVPSNPSTATVRQGVIRGGVRERLFAPKISKWFEILQVQRPDLEKIGFAFPADEIVQAELANEKLRLVLAQTFAHIAEGVAIFDTHRKLVIFNPALSDIFEMDSVWFASMPTLREFLDKLRSEQKIPTPREFHDWRRLRNAMENVGPSENYQEVWQIPNGRTIRVSGRSHSVDSAAFIFEDITEQTQTQGNLRNELALLNAIMPELSEGIAIFDPAGTLVCSNKALFEIWDETAAHEGASRTLTLLTNEWRTKCQPNSFWGELREFVGGYSARAPWYADISRVNGDNIRCSISAMPDGSTLVVFDPASGN